MDLTSRTIALVTLLHIATGEVKLHDDATCEYYKTNAVDSSPSYFKWLGARVTDCRIGFTRANDNNMICIRVTDYSIGQCDHGIAYYKRFVTSGLPPLKSIGCHSPPPTSWCCNSDIVKVLIIGKGTGSFAFEGYTKPIDNEKDDCLPKPPVRIVTPKPPTKGVFNTQALTEEFCNSNQITVVSKYPAMYQWSAASVKSCTVGFHNANSQDSNTCLCVDIVDFLFNDCQYRVEYHGISTAGDPEKVIDCNEKHNKWCTAESTMKIKFDEALNADDLFVFKVYVQNETCVTQSGAKFNSINGLLLLLVIFTSVL